MLSELIHSNKNRPGQFRTFYVRSDSTRPIFFGDNMKEIQLTKGMVALVDDEDYEWLNQWTWFAVKEHNNWYAATNMRENGSWQTVRMHRLILGLKRGNNIKSDHKNRNGLSNSRNNLRTCTNQQNIMNQRPQGGTSKFKGVSRRKNTKKWFAQIGYQNQNIYIGYYDLEIEAAKAYDKKAKELYGEFAFLNYPDKGCNLCNELPFNEICIDCKIAEAEHDVLKAMNIVEELKKEKADEPEN